MTALTLLLRWMDASSRRERWTSAAVVVLIVGLVTFALVPAPRIGPNALEAGGLPVAEYDASPVANQPVGVSAGPEAPAVPSTPGAVTPGVTTVTTAFTGGGGPAPVPETTVPLRATERGVTADSIKVGFAAAGFAGAVEAGIVTSMRTDVSEAIDALVDYANDRGGVLGRRIEPVKVEPDLLSESDQRQKCLELTETEGVFAVVDSFAFWHETAAACITAEHKTLLLNGSPGSAENVRNGFPYAVSVYKDDNRKMKDLVVAAKTAGFFDPARGFEKLGIYADCTPSMLDEPGEGLHAQLEAAGVTEWSEFRVACDATPRGGKEAVLQFAQDGVTHVLLISRPPPVKDLVDSAGASLFYPKYFAGDYLNLILGGLVADFDPVGFDGALGVTQTHAGEGAIGRPLPPLAQTCSDIIVEHGLPPISSAPPDDLGDDLQILEICESFFLFLQAATAAGPELTTPAWLDALSRVGEFHGASTDLSRFDRRGKNTGGDTMKLVKWHRDCTCWKQLTEFGPAAG
ncbi:MAG TPA: ABC transporter substrate-binding protein [Acidimicrobiia bacterium]|nr:ABC transporter substrate-binding protein [Acidimicrobiia bacterium]